MKVKKFNVKLLKKKTETKPLKQRLQLLWRGLPPLKGVNQYAELQGNANARALMLLPPANEEEILAGGALANSNGVLFNKLLHENDISLSNEFLLVPSSRGGKPSKATTKDVITFVGLALAIGKFKVVVCLGGDSFKYVLGDGYKPSITSLAGNEMFLPDKLGHTPVFVLPDINLLSIPFDGNDDWHKEHLMFTANKHMRSCIKLLKEKAYL